MPVIPGRTYDYNKNDPICSAIGCKRKKAISLIVSTQDK